MIQETLKPQLNIPVVTGQPFRSASLFSGIGGFDLASDWMGWETVFNCEWNEFGRRILNYYWPKAISYGDITKTDFTIHRGTINILTGGFPCQPYSAAGKRLGKEDERHLWPEMLRAIREIQPPWVVGENVRGLTTWNGGLVFDEVQADLEAEGYEVLPFLLPASGVNAPHERYRIWFVAYSTSNRREWTGKGIEIEKRLQQRPEPTGKLAGRFERLCFQGNATNAFDTGLQRNELDGTFNQRKERKQTFRPVAEFSESCDVTNTDAARERRNEWKSKSEGNIWEQFPTESPLCGRNDGLSSRLDGITIPKHRNESIKAYGNAIVPQVVYQIYKAIASYEAQYGCR
jgi:DNA (cytosine-5)-methyltransferase 1